MAIYSRIKAPYDLNKQFRLNNGTVLDKNADLIYWLRTTEGSDTFVDFSKPAGAITTAGPGALQTRGGPNIRFPIKSLNFDSKSLTVSDAYAADASSNNSLVFGGWIYLNSDPDLNNDGFPILRATAADGYSIYVDNNSRLAVRFGENPVSSTVTSTEIRTSLHCIPVGAWVHFVVCLDVGSRLDSTRFQQFSRIFINGRKQTTEIGTTRNPSGLSGLNGTIAGSSIIFGYGQAADEDGLIYLDGKLADMFLFQTKGDLTDDQATGLFTGTQDGSFNLSSGFISTSPRNTVRDADNRNVNAANLSLFSNDGRLGNHTVFFDDSRAQNVTTPGPTNFPSMLNADNPLFSQIYSGHVDGQLSTTAAASSFGVYKQYYEENNTVQYKPFVESKVYNEHSASFYLTGTEESILNGFNQNIANKAQISFYGDVSQETVIGSTTAISAPDPGNWLAYYSFTDNNFVNAGSLRGTSSTVGDSGNTGDRHREDFLFANALAFAPLGGQVFMGLPKFETAEDGAPSGFTFYENTGSFFFPLSGSRGIVRNFCRPIDSFGFPGTDQYEASDNVTIKLSDRISEPFLLEKISVRFDFSTQFALDDKLAIRQDIKEGTGAGGTGNIHRPGNIGTIFRHINDGATNASGKEYAIYAKMITAFILRQSKQKKAAYTYISDFGTGKEPHNTIVREVTGSFRDLIGYGQTLILQEDNNFSSDLQYYIKAFDHTGSIIAVNKDALLDAGLSREQNIILPDSDGVSTSNIITNTAEINFVPKNVFASDARGAIQVHSPLEGGSSAQTRMMTQWKHDRSFLYDDRELVEERRYTNGVNGTIPDKVLPEITMTAGQGVTTDLITFDSPPLNDEDFEKSAPYMLFPEDELILGIQGPIGSRWATGNELEANYIKVLPSKIQLTLYGSFLRQNRPVRLSHSQHLNTSIVTEAIGPLKTFDSFNISQRIQYAGTYSDEIMSGSVDSADNYSGYDHVTNSEITLARRVGGRASEGTQGEKGALRIYNRIADTTERDLDSIMPSFLDISLADEAAFGVQAVQGAQTSEVQIGIGDSGNKNYHWLYAFPFESRYEGIRRTDQFVNSSGETIDSMAMFISDASGHNRNVFAIQQNGTQTSKAMLVPRNFAGYPAAADAAFGGGSGEFNPNLGFQHHSYEVARRLLFGIGDLSRGRYYVVTQNTGDRIGLAYMAGFKYGVSNTSPNFAKAVYSRNSFGQFRDLLEMRNFTANVVDNTTTHVVTQKFSTRNEQPLSETQRGQTSCSNLSSHATSSLPFFDRPNSSPALNRDPIVTGPTNISPNFEPGAGPFRRTTGF